MVSLGHGEDRVVNGQLTAFRVSLVLLDLLLLLLLLLLLSLTAGPVAVVRTTHLHLLLAETATVGTVWRRWIGKSARTANTRSATALVSVGRSTALPRSFRHPTVTYRYTRRGEKTKTHTSINPISTQFDRVDSRPLSSRVSTRKLRKFNGPVGEIK